MKLSILVLIGALLIAASSWASNVNLDSWKTVLEVKNFFSLLGALGAVMAAWASKAPNWFNRGK